MVAFGFLPQNLAGGVDLQMILCHSLNAVLLVGTIMGGRDTRIPPVVIEFM